jgi:hypothetical protein
MCAYGNPKKAAWLKDEFKKAGKKLAMGKSCLRFKKLDDLPLAHTVRVWRTGHFFCGKQRCLAFLVTDMGLG